MQGFAGFFAGLPCIGWYKLYTIYGKITAKHYIRFVPALKFIVPTKSKTAAIYLRLIAGKGKDFKRKTGFIIDESKWNHRKGFPKYPSQLTHDLKKLALRVEQAYNKANEEGKSITSTWYENVLYSRSKEEIGAYIDDFLSRAGSRRNALGGQGLSKNRIDNLKTFKNLLHKYQSEIYLSEIDKSWADNFTAWMKEKNYSQNYISKAIDNLKMFLRDAKITGHKITNEIDAIKAYRQIKRPEEIIILTPDDIGKIQKLDLNNQKLENTRKWLILGVNIGQRGSDLLKLKEKDIKDIGGAKVIELKQQKTGKNVVVPILPEVYEMLQNGFPYSISLQKFNEYLKELGSKAKIDKHLSSHVMRRSFASNYYGKVPTAVLIGITGHSTEKQFREYIGKGSYDAALDFLDIISGKK